MDEAQIMEVTLARMEENLDAKSLKEVTVIARAGWPPAMARI